MRLAAYARFRLRSFYGATIAACLLMGCSLDRSPSHLVLVLDSHDDASVPVTGAAGPTVAVQPVATNDGTVFPSAGGQAGGSALPPAATVDAGNTAAAP